MRELNALPNDRPKYIGPKEETLTCEDCHKEWTRFSRRGRKPPRCPECQTAKDNAPRISAEPDPEQVAARAATARAGKAEKARERAEQADHEQAQRVESIRRQLPNLHLLWNHAFDKAMETNSDEDWRKAESLMSNYVNAKRSLESPREFTPSITTRGSDVPVRPKIVSPKVEELREDYSLVDYALEAME